jgi:hypothetical protein
MSSSEKTKAAGLQGIIDYIESDEIDAADSYGNLLEVADMAEKALAASKETDLERLSEWAMKQQNIDKGVHRAEEVQCWSRLLDYIADQIGGEAEDADRED